MPYLAISQDQVAGCALLCGLLGARLALLVPTFYCLFQRIPFQLVEVNINGYVWYSITRCDLLCRQGDKESWVRIEGDNLYIFTNLRLIFPLLSHLFLPPPPPHPNFTKSTRPGYHALLTHGCTTTAQAHPFT
jgi:hypothetical protein